MQLNHQPNALTAAQRPRMILAAAAVAAFAAAIVALHPPATPAAQAKGAVVSTARTSLGRIIVNANGRTLYLFEKDRNGKSACSGQCAAFWPPLITNGKPVARRGGTASLIGTIKRADGRLQVTYTTFCFTCLPRTPRWARQTARAWTPSAPVVHRLAGRSNDQEAECFIGRRRLRPPEGLQTDVREAAAMRCGLAHAIKSTNQRQATRRRSASRSSLDARLPAWESGSPERDQSPYIADDARIPKQEGVDGRVRGLTD
jgi:predicted lipoprotein with Yx(FWY)xxD motif